MEDHRLMYRNMHTHSDQFPGTTSFNNSANLFHLPNIQTRNGGEEPGHQWEYKAVVPSGDQGGKTYN